MTAGVMLLAGIRILHVAALLIAFGALLLPALAGRAAGAVERITHRLASGGALVALATGGIWFLLQAAAFAEASDIRTTLAAVPATATTRFGEVLLLREALLVAALLLHRSRVPVWLAIVAAGLAVALQPLLGHAGAQLGALGWSLVGTEMVHLLAAGAWIGALPALLAAASHLQPPAAATLCRRFSPIGIAAVALLAGTGLAQGGVLVGGLPNLVGTFYGRIALVKVGLFAAMLGLALANRLWLVERLDGRRPHQARALLHRSILAETLLGLLTIAAAACMANLAPSLHQQPLWPFSWQLSGLALRDDDLRQEIATALLMVGVAAAVVATSFYWRRFRVLAVLIAGGLFASWLPTFGLFLVPAYPTSFYTSPTSFAVQDIVQGQALFRVHCLSCHGAEAAGNGPAALDARIRPADLTAAHLFDHPDGELFWWLTDGMQGPDGTRVMPAFSETLTEADRWDLIDYLRAHNAGIAFRDAGAPPVPIPAPAMPVRCPDPRIASLADLRGGLVVLVADDPGLPPPAALPPQDGSPVTIVRLRYGREGCTAASAEAWPAYATLAGVAPDALAGTAFLVDAQGWLRAVRHPIGRPAWSDPARLVTELRDICTQPLTQSAGVSHVHTH